MKSTLKKFTSKTILEYIILSTINTFPDPVKQIAERLENFEMRLPMGTLYPIIRSLYTRGLIHQGYEEMDQGTPRKTYSISQKGLTRLSDLTYDWNKINHIIELANRNELQ